MAAADQKTEPVRPPDGQQTFKLVGAATTNATVVKAAPGVVYGWNLSGIGAAAFLRLYDKATAPTVGTDVPKLTIPAASGGVNFSEFLKGIAFLNGIAIAITAAVADNDATAIAAGGAVVNLFFE